MSMQRYLGLETVPAPLGPSVVTIGKFFAVHRGHQALIRATVQSARSRGARAVVLTFDRHPWELLRPGTRLPLLTTLEERLELIEALGPEAAVVINLSPQFLGLEPEAFVETVLVRTLGAVEVLASGPFRFGRRASGTLETLRELGERHGFACTTIEPTLAGGERISSSRVARCIEAGRVAEAAELLGRHYSLPGRVVAGARIGRKLGFPTANLEVAEDRLLPADGVYVTRVRPVPGILPSPDEAGWPAVANLGVRPTRDGRRRVLEAHLLDRELDLYGEVLRVEFLDRLRAEIRFPDLESLRSQIARDVDAARGFFQRPA